jgi:hypothetical protein
VTGVLVTNLFCHFRVPRELHSDQGCNFKSWILQEVLQSGLGKSVQTTLLRAQECIKNPLGKLCSRAVHPSKCSPGKMLLNFFFLQAKWYGEW